MAGADLGRRACSLSRPSRARVGSFVHQWPTALPIYAILHLALVVHSLDDILRARKSYWSYLAVTRQFYGGMTLILEMLLRDDPGFPAAGAGTSCRARGVGLATQPARRYEPTEENADRRRATGAT